MRNSANQTTATATNIRYTTIVWLNSTGPTIGIRSRNGIGSRSKRVVVFSVSALGTSTSE